MPEPPAQGIHVTHLSPQDLVRSVFDHTTTQLAESPFAYYQQHGIRTLTDVGQILTRAVIDPAKFQAFDCCEFNVEAHAGTEIYRELGEYFAQAEQAGKRFEGAGMTFFDVDPTIQYPQGYVIVMPPELQPGDLYAVFIGIPGEETSVRVGKIVFTTRPFPDESASPPDGVVDLAAERFRRRDTF